ncbi:amidohydrolase family protein [Glaciimonas sp. GG7]
MIDSHFHIWQLALHDYDWLTPALGPIYRDFSIADWRVHAQKNGIEQGILVQATATEAETHFLLAAAAHYPESVIGVVGWVDLEADDASARIAALAGNPLLRSLRPMLQDIPDPDWILQPRVIAALRTLPALGLSFDALIKPIHLARIAQLARLIPDLNIIIDHGAKPDIASGEIDDWMQNIALLAALPHVFCKLSGLVTESGAAPSLTACDRVITQLLTLFPKRTLWGSDWPVLELASDYTHWSDHAHHCVATHGSIEADVFRNAALCAYGLGLPPNGM